MAALWYISIVLQFFNKVLKVYEDHKLKKTGFLLKWQNQNSELFQHHKNRKNPSMHFAKLQAPELF